MDHDMHDHDRGLSHDLPTLLNRRRLLAGLGGLGGLAALAACDPGQPAASSTGAATPTAAASTGAASTGGRIPEETAGPFPGDGSNGVNVLTQSGIVRGDITRSFGSGSAVARGVPLTIRLTVTDTASGAVPLAGAAVYVWHCDIDGNYSLYADGLTGENYLRGVQETDAGGEVRFTSVYPGAYSGRWPHIHFEVYPSLAKAATASGKLRTSQLALPQAACAAVYATDGYGQSASNLSRSSLEQDMVFSDGYSLQLATVTGAVGQGMTAALTVPV